MTSQAEYTVGIPKMDTAQAIHDETEYIVAKAKALVRHKDVRDADVRESLALTDCEEEYRKHRESFALLSQVRDELNADFLASNGSYYRRMAERW